MEKQRLVELRPSIKRRVTDDYGTFVVRSLRWSSTRDAVIVREPLLPAIRSLLANRWATTSRSSNAARITR